MIAAILVLTETLMVSFASLGQNACNEKYISEAGLTCGYCPPGTHWTSDCEKDGATAACAACPQGSYQEKCNVAHFCNACECPFHKMEIEQKCTWTTNQMCRCQEGTHWHEEPASPGEVLCLPHSQCPRGQGLLIPASTENDTVCEPCLYETYSDTDSFEPCSQCTKCETYQSKCTPLSDSVCQKTGPDLVIIIPSVVIPICIVAVILGYWLVNKRRRTQKEPREKRMEMQGPPDSPPHETDTAVTDGVLEVQTITHADETGGRDEPARASGNTQGATNDEDQIPKEVNPPPAGEEGTKNQDDLQDSIDDLEAEKKDKLPESKDNRMKTEKKGLVTHPTSISAESTKCEQGIPDSNKDNCYMDSSLPTAQDPRLRTGNGNLVTHPTSISAEHTKDEHGFTDLPKDSENDGNKIILPTADDDQDEDRRLRTTGEGLVTQPTSSRAESVSNNEEFIVLTKGHDTTSQER